MERENQIDISGPCTNQQSVHHLQILLGQGTKITMQLSTSITPSRGVSSYTYYFIRQKHIEKLFDNGTEQIAVNKLDEPLL